MIRGLLQNQSNWDKTAVIEGGRQHSYRELAQKAVNVQKLLSKTRGGIAAIFLPNGADYISALFGTLTSGTTAFPMNTALTKHEIAPLLEQVSAHTVITSLKYAELFEKNNSHMDVIYMEELTGSENDKLPITESIGADEPMVLLTTSGTSGKAKIVQLSERNVRTTVLSFADFNDYARFHGEIRYVLGTPYSSVYGLLILSACLLKSFPIVVLEGEFTLEALYRSVQEHRVTHYEGGVSVPILMDQTSEKPIQYDISSLQFVGFGGSKVPADVLGRLASAFPDIEFCQGYGMTESASLISRPYKRIDPNILDTAGIAINNVTIMVDADGIITDAPFMTGEVIVKGPNVMLGYYDNEEETSKVLKNGYLYTGDIGYLDEKGNLFLSGRKKNVIMVRGFSVYAEEVESCILKSGLVRDCFVYGETDTSGYETVRADVVAVDEQAQAEDIHAYCRDHLADYKRPRKIEIVEEIRKTVTGKTERAKRVI